MASAGTGCRLGVLLWISHYAFLRLAICCFCVIKGNKPAIWKNAERLYMCEKCGMASKKAP